MKWLLPCLALVAASCKKEEPESFDSFPKEEIVQVKGPQISSREGVVSVEILTAKGEAGIGSGAYILFNNKTYVITAAHVIEDSLITVVSTRGHSTSAKPVFINKQKDIAILQVDVLDDIKPIKLIPRQDFSLKLGEELYYSGFPNGFGPLTIQGTIAAFDAADAVILQSYAWPGASGSLVLDKRGKVVGVLVAIELITGRNGEIINNANIVYVNLIDKNFMDVLNDLLD